jgi:hypothetical protein
MTKTISTLMILSALSFGSAAQAGETQRVAVNGPARKAVVAGPVAMHAYSGFSGGAIYAVRAVSGTDADCQGAPIGGTRAELPADAVIDFQVGAGQVACLETTTSRGFELLWHAQKDAPAPTVMLAKAGR